MAVYELNALTDFRWPDFLQVHPKASVFHTPAWLSALSLTYGYDPFVITTTPPGQPLQNGIAFCRVNSWLTGSRLISIPFSDHCEPLVDNSDDFNELLEHLRVVVSATRAKYYELRPRSTDCIGETTLRETAPRERFALHTLDLLRDVDIIFRNCHRSCIQRKVQRATKEGLTVDAGRSDYHQQAFYKLLLLTRRRHRLPPQPFAWFRNLARSCGDSIVIRLALRDGKPIAGILTLSNKKTVVYKYGCSDATLHNCGAMPFLLWNAILDAKANETNEFDFGRSDHDNTGLITFKDNWGATRTNLFYYRYPATPYDKCTNRVRQATIRRCFSFLPDACVQMAGRLLYRHVA
jgi:hypothetical protein